MPRIAKPRAPAPTLEEIIRAIRVSTEKGIRNRHTLSIRPLDMAAVLDRLAFLEAERALHQAAMKHQTVGQYALALTGD